MIKRKQDYERDLICDQLEKGEISYTSLPSKWKKDYSIIAKSKFEDVLKEAPNAFWKNKNFVRAVLLILKRETENEGFNEKSYMEFVEKVKKNNKPDSKVWNIVISDFFNYKEYNQFLLNLLNAD